MIHSLKLGALAAASILPGRIGEEATTRYLRRLRTTKGKDALAAFDARLAKLSTGALCIDLGANVGEYTRLLAETGATVHAFEPDPWTFERLKEEVGHLDNVRLHNLAVGTANETVTMRRAPDFADNPEESSVGNSVVKFSGDLPTGETLDVQCIDFLEFLRGLGRKVDLIKMDIEGAEVPILETLLDAPECDLIDALFVETHEVNMPELRRKTRDLKARAARPRRTFVNLDWP